MDTPFVRILNTGSPRDAMVGNRLTHFSDPDHSAAVTLPTGGLLIEQFTIDPCTESAIFTLWLGNTMIELTLPLRSRIRVV